MLKWLDLPGAPRQGLCPFTPLGAYGRPQTPRRRHARYAHTLVANYTFLKNVHCLTSFRRIVQMFIYGASGIYKL